jgi:hypothetical protein
MHQVLRRHRTKVSSKQKKGVDMKKIQGKEAEGFVTWLTMVSRFLPQNMTIEEAQNIYMRKIEEEKSGEKERC